MKTNALIPTLLAISTAGALAGTIAIDPAPAPLMAGGFDTARRPITNPTLFDSALPTTNIHPIFMYHRLPSYVNTTIGQVPMDGHVEVYALQFEIALSERLSLVATKDGYVRIDPGTTPLWSDQSGFANLAGGLKYTFILDPVNSLAVSGSATAEIPTGNHDVFQGEGEVTLNLILSALKIWDRFQLAGGGGVRLPFEGQSSTSSFVSAHASYEVVPWFIPLVEVNWHHVLSAGNGRPNFSSQAGGAVPQVAMFEGSDLLNFGAANSTANRDLVTAGVGFRSRLAAGVDLGVAYEIPLTNEHDGIIDDRFTLDLVWRF